MLFWNFNYSAGGTWNYVTTTSLQVLWPKSTNLLRWYRATIHQLILALRLHPVAQWQCVRAFWRDTCADLIMTLTVIGRNWLNPAHVLGWSCHFNKKYTSSFYCSNIFAYNVTQPTTKNCKNRWPEDVLMFFSPKTQVTSGFAKGTKLRIRCFSDLPLQFGWLFRRVWPLKMLGCLNSLTSTWLLEKYLPDFWELNSVFVHVHVSWIHSHTPHLPGFMFYLTTCPLWFLSPNRTELNMPFNAPPSA